MFLEVIYVNLRPGVSCVYNMVVILPLVCYKKAVSFKNGRWERDGRE
jgi:hypothetical protein